MNVARALLILGIILTVTGPIAWLSMNVVAAGDGSTFDYVSEDGTAYEALDDLPGREFGDEFDVLFKNIDRNAVIEMDPLSEDDLGVGDDIVVIYEVYEDRGYKSVRIVSVDKFVPVGKMVGAGAGIALLAVGTTALLAGIILIMRGRRRKGPVDPRHGHSDAPHQGSPPGIR